MGVGFKPTPIFNKEINTMIVSLLEKIKEELIKISDGAGKIPNVKTVKIGEGNYNLLITKEAGTYLSSQIRYINIARDVNRSDFIKLQMPWEPKYTALLLLGIPQNTYYGLLNASKAGIGFEWYNGINATTSSTGKNIKVTNTSLMGIVTTSV